MARRAVRLQLLQVWNCPLDSIIEPRWDRGYQFRQLEVEELGKLGADPTNCLEYHTTLRLAAASHRCFAALDGSTLACYVWLAEHSVGHEDTMGFRFAIPADTCYLFNAFTVPAYREQGIYTRTAKRALLEMSQFGKSQGLALVEYGNLASMRSHRRIGLKPQGWIGSLGDGTFAYRWYSSPVQKLGLGDYRSHKIP